MKQLFLFSVLLSLFSCSEPDKTPALSRNIEDTKATFLENYVIVGKDTVLYPGELELNISYHFSAFRSDTLYNLEVTRTSNRILHYKFKCEKEATAIIANEGEVKLNDSFYLAPESDDDSEKQENYASNEYLSTNNDCNVVIRIGTRRDDANRIRAKFNITCSGKSGDVRLTSDNTPVLRTETQKQ